MKKYLLISAAATGLALSGCDSNDVENTPIDDVDEIVAEDDEGYPVAGELSDDQRTQFDALDRDAAAMEYDTNQTGMHSGAADGHSGDTMSSGDSSAQASQSASGTSSNTSQASASSDMNASSDVKPLRPRSQMDFAFLDRNGDGQLSVAEYAIWAVRSNPREPKPNDNNRPYTSVDQINEAGETFFYFDADGDTYLSPQEFGAARSSARTPS